VKLVVEAAGRSTILDPKRSHFIGRDTSSEIQISNSKVSRKHARLDYSEGKWALQDLNSANGTYLKGKSITKVEIRDGLKVNLGNPSGVEVTFSLIQSPNDGFLAADKTQYFNFVDSNSVEREGIERNIKLGKRLTIGRDVSNQWLIEDPRVSRFHAEIVLESSGTYQIRDLKSFNGTFVNGKEVKRQILVPNDEISIGGITRTFTGNSLSVDIGFEDQGVEIRNLSVTFGTSKILNHLNVSLPSKSLTAIIGPSGSGKSTLLKALTGRITPSQGSVMVHGCDVVTDYSILRQKIGLVPQADIIHTQLTVEEALRYGAKLRLPSDSNTEEIEKRVNEVIEQLALQERRQLKVAQLSGGQKKRVSIGLELLTKPEILVLDEPTSGLDPGLDAHVMELLRDLANNGQTVVVVTHAVENLGVCDNLVVLATGGHLVHFGSPETVFASTGVEQWSDLFTLLSEYEPHYESTQEIEMKEDSRSKSAVVHNSRKSSLIKTYSTLSRRYATVIKSDRGYLALLLLTPTVIGIICWLTASRWGYGIGQLLEIGVNYNATARGTTLVLVLGSIFIGLSASVQEIVKEKEIFLREKNVGIGVLPYFLSKSTVLGLIATIQTSIFVSIVLFNRPPAVNSPFGTRYFMVVILICTALCLSSIFLGLLISSAISTPDQAMPILVGIVMIQIVLSGVLPISTGRLVDMFGRFMPSYMSTNALASATNLAEITLVQSKSLLARWTPTADNVYNMLAQLGSVTLLLATIALVNLQRKD
jgi:ABC-type multidrug transport system ATPase subunit